MNNKTQALFVPGIVCEEQHPLGRKDLKASHQEGFSRLAQFMLVLLESFVLRICPSIPHAVKKLKTKQTLEGFCCPNRCVQRMEKKGGGAGLTQH